MNLGKFNTLRVRRRVDFGIYLEDDHGERVLLPQRYVPEGVQVGDMLDVFLYLDEDEKLVATTERPLAQVGDFAYLETAWVNQYGAFLKWGPMKDLFCPFREQKKRMEIGNSYIVHVLIDEESYRLMASAKVERYLDTARPDYSHGDEVQVLVWQKTDLGFKVIVDNRYAGLVYKDQIFRHIHTGDRLTAYVEHVRDDGKIDITLQPTGRQQTEQFSEQLLAWLKERGGHCDLGDKSPSEAIAARFGVSKKTFKRAVGDLYKRRLITMTDESLTLL